MFETGFNYTMGERSENGLGLREREDEKPRRPLKTQGSRRGGFVPTPSGKEIAESKIRHCLLTGQELPERFRSMRG